jgi:hypothetical protein
MQKIVLKLLVLSISIAALMVGSCAKNNPVAPSQAPSQGKMSFALEAADNAVTGKVTIAKGALTEVLPISITNHAGTVMFSDIQVGTWQIQVQLFDAGGVEIYTGNGTALVTLATTTTVTIRVNHNTGHLQIIVNVPSGGYVNDQKPDVVLTGLNASSVWSDKTKMFVADSNGSILIFNSIPTTAGVSPDVILGGLGADLVRSDGKKLIVSSTANDRVMIYNSIPTNNSASPDVTLTGVNYLGWATTDGAKLYVLETWYNNVLIFNTIPDNNNTSPDVVLSGINNAWSICSDGARLFLSNFDKSVFIYNSIPSNDSATPDVVLRPDLGFDSRICSDGKCLFVCDRYPSTDHSRILVFNTIPTNGNAIPDAVIKGFYALGDVCSDGVRLLVIDNGSVSIFNQNQ